MFDRFHGAKSFYAYEIAYPDGTVFYVGKGMNGPGSLDRLRWHLYAARGRYMHKELYQVIRNIWAQGGCPIVRRIQEHMTEPEALKLELQLCLFHGYQNLVNKPTFLEIKMRREMIS